MPRISRDLIVSIILLLFCGFLIWSGTLIRDPQFGELSPAAWPKGATWVLTAFCVLYFLQSVIRNKKAIDLSIANTSTQEREFSGPIGWLEKYQNPILCFLLYFGFLFTLPYFGTLIGGILLVFLLLSVLGGVQPKQIVFHGFIALVSVGAMWALFTYGLRVLLPRGEILPGI